MQLPPEDLIATAWLKKVGGVLHAHKSPTCNGSVYDYFIVAASISDQVQSTHLIGDAGLTPDSPARLIFRGTPRKTMVRHLKAPQSLPAVLPHGPLREPEHEFDALVENARSIDQNYATLVEQTDSILRGLIGTESKANLSEQTHWENGPKFVWKNVASPAASDKARSTPVSTTATNPRETTRPSRTPTES